MKLIRSMGNQWPGHELADLFDVDRLFSWQHTRQPAVNVREDNRCYHLDVIIPGFKKEEVRVTLEDEMLIIAGEHKTEAHKETERYTRQEYAVSSFSRSFSLPKTVMADKIDARYDHGILTLTLPKQAEMEATKKRVRIL